MLFQPLVEKLRDMRLYGMLSAMEEQSENSQYRKLSFEERLGFLVDREWSVREEKRLKKRIKNARFKERALMEAWTSHQGAASIDHRCFILPRGSGSQSISMPS